MSFNIMAAVVREDSGEGVLMTLPRAGAGITHSASIGRGDIISFNGIRMHVNQILHHYHAPGSPIAPVSVAYCGPENPLSPSEIQVLKDVGFQTE